jgi:DNA-directed RNA polymerase subunit RPC12/RpoP
MIRFTCPHCQKNIKVDPEGAGRTITCPRCRNRLVVPPPIREGPAIGKIVSEPTGISSKPQVSAMPPAVPSEPAQVLFHCPGCGRAILLSPEDLNQKLQCTVCGAQFVPAEPRVQPAIEPQSSPDLFEFEPAPSEGPIEGIGAAGQRTQKKLLTVVVMALMMVIAGIAFCFWVASHLRHSVSDFLSEGLDFNHQIVMDYLRNNLNDPEGLEVVGWTEVEKYKTGNIALNLKYRAKNPLGTKTLHYDRFWIRNGKVITTFPEELLHWEIGDPVSDWHASESAKMKEEELRGEKSDSLKER